MVFYKNVEETTLYKLGKNKIYSYHKTAQEPKNFKYVTVKCPKTPEYHATISQENIQITKTEFNTLFKTFYQ